MDVVGGRTVMREVTYYILIVILPINKERARLNKLFPKHQAQRLSVL